MLSDPEYNDQQSTFKLFKFVSRIQMATFASVFSSGSPIVQRLIDQKQAKFLLFFICDFSTVVPAGAL